MGRDQHCNTSRQPCEMTMQCVSSLSMTMGRVAWPAYGRCHDLESKGNGDQSITQHGFRMARRKLARDRDQGTIKTLKQIVQRQGEELAWWEAWYWQVAGNEQRDLDYNTVTTLDQDLQKEQHAIGYKQKDLNYNTATTREQDQHQEQQVTDNDQQNLDCNAATTQELHKELDSGSGQRGRHVTGVVEAGEFEREVPLQSTTLAATTTMQENKKPKPPAEPMEVAVVQTATVSDDEESQQSKRTEEDEREWQQQEAYDIIDRALESNPSVSVASFVLEWERGGRQVDQNLWMVFASAQFASKYLIDGEDIVRRNRGKAQETNEGGKHPWVHTSDG